jgi:hypothetical protein
LWHLELQGGRYTFQHNNIIIDFLSPWEKIVKNGILISMESSLNWEFSRRVRKQHSSTQEKTPENHHRDRKHLVSATIEKQGLPRAA